MKRILFICKYNRFRSKTAEAIFNKLNKDKSIIAKSAGLVKGASISKVNLEVASELGLKIREKPLGLTTELLKWQDTLIIVADDIPKSLFKENKDYGKKLIWWSIPDSKTDTKEEIRKITKQIELKVRGLLR
jgi:protein-tyrosine-phosphatase